MAQECEGTHSLTPPKSRQLLPGPLMKSFKNHWSSSSAATSPGGRCRSGADAPPLRDSRGNKPQQLPWNVPVPLQWVPCNGHREELALRIVISCSATSSLERPCLVSQSKPRTRLWSALNIHGSLWSANSNEMDLSEEQAAVTEQFLNAEKYTQRICLELFNAALKHSKFRKCCLNSGSESLLTSWWWIGVTSTSH